MKVSVSVSLSLPQLGLIDEARGMESRSAFVSRAVEFAMSHMPAKVDDKIARAIAASHGDDTQELVEAYKDLSVPSSDFFKDPA